MTPEQRLDRAEYILVRLAMSGRQARSEFRYKINSLIHAQMRNEAASRAESHELNEKINLLIRTQMDTGEQIKATNEQLKDLAAYTNKQIKDLAASQAELAKSQKLTDQALRAFINGIRKRGNGNSSD